MKNHASQMENILHKQMQGFIEAPQNLPFNTSTS